LWVDSLSVPFKKQIKYEKGNINRRHSNPPFENVEIKHLKFLNIPHSFSDKNKRKIIGLTAFLQ